MAKKVKCIKNGYNGLTIEKEYAVEWTNGPFYGILNDNKIAIEYLQTSFELKEGEEMEHKIVLKSDNDWMARAAKKMTKVASVACLVLAFSANVEAGESCKEEACKKGKAQIVEVDSKPNIEIDNKPNIHVHVNNNPKQTAKVEYKTRWKTNIVYRDNGYKRKYEALLAAYHKLAKEKSRVRTVVKIKKVVKVRKIQPKKNAISILGGASATKLKVSENENTYKADTAYEPDFGLMYNRDFGRIRGTIGLTLRGSGYLGVGLNF